jgi:hypothetical protein
MMKWGGPGSDIPPQADVRKINEQREKKEKNIQYSMFNSQCSTKAKGERISNIKQETRNDA